MSERPAKTKSRDPGVELMRTLMMFGVCVLHTAQIGVPFEVLSANSILWAFFVCSVDGFVFISGYYGIRFRLSKIVSLYAVGAFCAFVNIVGLIALGHPVVSSIYEVVERFLCGTWFLHAYVVLMCFAPLLNRCIDETNKELAIEVAVPIILLVFGWTWLSGEFRILKIPFPNSTGFGSHTWLTLLGVYVLARVYRVLGLKQHVKGWMVLVLVPVIVVVTAFYRGILGSYNSPQILLLTMLVFWSFQRLRVSPFWEKVAVLVSPSLFAIYLLHYGPCGRLLYEHFAYIKTSQSYPIVILSAIFATAVFVLSLAADIPRRCLMHCFYKSLCSASEWLDRKYQKLIEKGCVYYAKEF